MNTRVFSKNPVDIPLLGATILLVAVGLITIYDASVVAAFRDFGDKLYYFKNQLIWASLGFMAMALFSFFDYHKLIKYAPIFLLASVFLLIIVLIPGIGTKVYGARRWISIANFTFQPSEIAKITLILYQTSIIARFEKARIKLLDAAIVIFLPAAFVSGLVLIQPDLVTALIFIGITLTMYFAGGGKIIHFLAAIPLIILAAIMSIVTHPYRIDRLKSLLDPTHDPQGASYQIYQILIAISSGGLLGVGLGSLR